jgi:sulfur-oxidizing protein SoxY
MDRQATRRQFLAAAAGTAVALAVRPAQATPETMKSAIRQIVGEAAMKSGRIKLDLPPLVENGNTVAMAVSVESPMTAKDYVKAIHVVTEKNPQPNVISAKLGPRAGKAEITTRVRLADTQTVIAICEMSDGSFWSDKVDVIITLGACLEDPV